MKRVLSVLDTVGTEFIGTAGTSLLLVDFGTGSTLTIEIKNPARTLGPGTNTFATTTTRNTYFTDADNADILAQYNDDRTLLIVVGTTHQRRNAAGTAWENHTPAEWLDVSAGLLGRANINADGQYEVQTSPEFTYRLTPAAAGSEAWLSYQMPTRGPYNLNKFF